MAVAVRQRFDFALDYEINKIIGRWFAVVADRDGRRGERMLKKTKTPPPTDDEVATVASTDGENKHFSLHSEVFF